MAKIKLDLAYAKYKDARGNYINNPVSGIVSGDTTAELYMTFEHVPVAFITVNKATVNIRRQSSHTTNYIYYGPLTNVASETSMPQLASETLLPVSVDDIGFIDPKTIYLSGNITPYLMYGIGFKGRDNGKTCTIYANSQSYRPYLELDYSVNYTASAKNIKVAHTDITQPTIVSWQTDLEQVAYELQVIQGVNVIFSTSGASAQSVSIPANTLLPGLDVIVKVRVTERVLNTNVTSDYAEYNFKPSFTYPTIDNLSYVGDFWEKPITVNWRSTYQEGYEWEAYYNNEKVSNGTGGTSSGFSIPANTFNGTLPSSVRIRVYRLYGENKYYSEWREKSLSLKDITATISNLLVTGEYWEKDIELSWQSTDQEQLKIEVFKDNTIVKTYTGTTSSRYRIPAETLTAGTYTFKVWVGYANRFVNFATKNVTLKDIVPTITELNLSGSNIDYDLSLTWKSTDQQKYEVQILKDSSVIDTRTGAMDKSILFVYGTLGVGAYTFKVRVGYKDRWSEYKSISTTLVETKPSIGALEPDSVIKKSDEEIRIWWTSTNQSKWKVVIDDALTYTGTLEMEKVVTPNTLSVGKHSILLTVTYVTAKGVEKPVTKKANFWVQGKPPIPTITSSNVFVTSMPVLTWDTQDQQGYLLEILQDNTLIWTTKWQNGLVTRQKVLAILKDGNYTARLKIINQFSVESDYAIQSFTVSTSEPVEITLKAESMEKFIRLSWDNLEDTFEKFYILRRGKAISCTTEMVYDDYTALGSETYTIIGLNSSNVAKYSNSVTRTCYMDGCFIASVDNLSYMFDVGKVSGNYTLKMQATLEHEVIACTGREKPITVFGEHVNNSYTLQFVDYDTYFEFVQIAKRKKILCYRDRHQKLFLSVGNFSYDLDNTMAEYNVPALEVSYSEVIEFD